MNDWHFILGIISGIVVVLAVIPYIKDILYGTTRPNIFSWLIWDLLLLISLLAQLDSGASWSIIIMVGDFIGTSIILVLSLSGYGYGKYSPTDWACLSLAIVAIVSWQVTNLAVLAILFSVLADFLAAIPTIAKSFKDPWSEAPTQFLLISLAAFLGVLSTTIFNAENLLFPVYLVLVNGTIGLTALTGRRLRPRS